MRTTRQHAVLSMPIRKNSDTGRRNGTGPSSIRQEEADIMIFRVFGMNRQDVADLQKVWKGIISVKPLGDNGFINEPIARHMGNQRRFHRPGHLSLQGERLADNRMTSNAAPGWKMIFRRTKTGPSF